MQGGALPKTEPVAEQRKSGESSDATNSRKLCADAAGPSTSHAPEKVRVRMAAAASLISVHASVQESSQSRTACGNNAGSRNENFPWPSFNSTATGWCCHAVLTTKSRK